MRHGYVGFASLLLVWLFWLSRPEWDPEMRLWRAFGDGAFILLCATLAMGPLAKLNAGFGRMIPWRSQVGIWFGLMALVHAFLVLKGWARWDLARLLGYEFIPQLGRTARLEPGFGLANLVGIAALFFTLILMATSTERAVKALGGSAWKWLHYSANTVFYLSVLHSSYFLFMHYTLSFHKRVPPPNWFRFPLLLLSIAIVILQFMAFVKTVLARKGDSATGAPGGAPVQVRPRR